MDNVIDVNASPSGAPDPNQGSQHVPFQAPPPPPPPPEPAQASKSPSAWSIVSLSTGIANYFLIPVIGAILALIAGYIARKEIRESNGRFSGDGMATAGIVLGWIGIALTIIVIALTIIFAVSMINLIPRIFS